MLINVVDSNEEKGKNVFINSWASERNLHISIRDEGPGVPNHIKDNIFEPFYTTKEVGKGTGLGLSVSHGIIRNLEGYISVGDFEEGGAIFTIIIPKTRKR